MSLDLHADDENPAEDSSAQQNVGLIDEEDSLDVGERLCRWLEANGAELSKLRIETYAPEVRGVHAKDAFQTKDRVMLIPLNCLITVEMGKATEIGQKLVHLEFAAPKHIFLMMYLLTDMELGNGSFFKCYFDSLPSTLTNMPIFWTDDELAWLQGSHILHQIAERRAAIERDYATICRTVPEFGDRFSLERFSWARMIVCSRNFGLSINGVKTAALVPYADMLNHFRPRETSWTFDDQAQGFTITALHAIGQGAQVYDSYGKKCNHRFLLNYGFAVANNVEEDGRNPNEVWMPLNFLQNEPAELTALKRRYLQDSGVYSMDSRFSTCHSDSNTREGLSFLRLIVATDAEFEIMSRRSPAHAAPPISLDNERRAIQHIGALMTVQLYQYQTSLADDEAALLTLTEPYSNRAQALYYMRGEKQVCVFYQQLAHTLGRLFAQAPEKIQATCREKYDDADTAESCYIEDVVGFLLPEDPLTTSNAATYDKSLDEVDG
ncbi:Aste57867_8440 [Aphanomyces stellatus]|uniref:Aste57867_8440 protein n=1 Tax=Aphanomyces stellatus TaxID=120398 RepID=A0A485KKA7_9STRA|nr:hypothetical protein As57867_008408 [Aphanomyces stellatus]VFT85326.1 Aste57867_8440 [Aphanomyces stellatus]